jgi:nucleotide-binding universal stress UspA family protein
MTPATEEPTIRHIVITLDASESGRPVLETAVRLAARLGAQLEGVFIEDSNLMRLAGLPFLRELRYWSLAEESFDPLRIQRELRTLARRAEQMLQQAAGELGVHWSFQVWRGRAGAEALAQSFAADILGLNPAGSLHAVRPARRERSRPGTPAVAAINILFSDSQAALRALSNACLLARDLATSLTILLPPGKTKPLQALKDKARGILEQYRQPARFVTLAGADARSLAHSTSSPGICVLMAEVGHPLLQKGGLDRCLAALSCPVLLVR